MDRKTGEVLYADAAHQRIAEGSLDPNDLMPIAVNNALTGTTDTAALKRSMEQYERPRTRWVHDPSATKKHKGPRKKRPAKAKRK